MDAAAALEELLLLAASSAAIDEANLLMDFTIEPHCSDDEFFVFWFGTAVGVGVAAAVEVVVATVVEVVVAAQLVH
jgi:hypothetical protein